MRTEKAIKNYDHSNDALVKVIIEKAVNFLLGILVCRGVIFTELAPFGGSFVAAVSRKNLFWTLFGKDGRTMTNAYSELYLDDAMQNLGDMVEYAVCKYKHSHGLFHSNYRGNYGRCCCILYGAKSVLDRFQ